MEKIEQTLARVSRTSAVLYFLVVCNIVMFVLNFWAGREVQKVLSEDLRVIPVYIDSANPRPGLEVLQTLREQQTTMNALRRQIEVLERQQQALHPEI